MSIRDAIVTTLFSLGTAFIFAMSIGLIKLPDFFCRSHALSKAMTMGISLILLATLIAIDTIEVGVKIVIALVFQFITVPLSGHILARVAYQKNIRRHKHQDILR